MCVCVRARPCVSVLWPLVEVFSDPDYINRMLLSQLEQREQLMERHRKAYSYAPSYEEFIKLISGSSDVDFLQQLRSDSPPLSSTHLTHIYEGAHTKSTSSAVVLFCLNLVTIGLGYPPLLFVKL